MPAARAVWAWEVEILAFHATDGCSNGLTEAVNLLIKKVKRVGYGFRNFTNIGCGWCSTAASPGRLTRPRACEGAPAFRGMEPVIPAADITVTATRCRRQRRAKHGCRASEPPANASWGHEEGPHVRGPLITLGLRRQLPALRGSSDDARRSRRRRDGQRPSAGALKNVATNTVTPRCR